MSVLLLGLLQKCLAFWCLLKSPYTYVQYVLSTYVGAAAGGLASSLLTNTLSKLRYLDWREYMLWQDEDDTSYGLLPSNSSHNNKTNTTAEIKRREAEEKVKHGSETLKTSLCNSPRRLDTDIATAANR